MKVFYVKNEQELVKKLKDSTFLKEIYCYLMDLLDVSDDHYTTNIKVLRKEISPTELFGLYVNDKYYRSIHLDLIILEIWERVQTDFIVKTIKSGWN